MGKPLEVERCSEDSEISTTRLLEPGPSQNVYSYPLRHHRRLWWYLSFLNLLLFLMTCIIYLPLRGQSIQDAYKATSFYSPLFDKDFSLELHESAMNKTLWGTNETTSIYIQDPSSEVDAAWDYISAEAGQVITISSREAKRLGRDPGVITKAPRDWELGDDAYLAQVDAFHEIHCLNMLRKEIFWDYYFRPRYGERENASYLHVRHVRHCLRIVLRTLMCNADVDIVTHNWHRGTYRPIADFDNPRKCRDFEALLSWNMDNAVPNVNEKWSAITRPTDAITLPRPTPNLYVLEDSYEWVNNV